MVSTNKTRQKSRSQIVNDFDKRKTKLGKGKQLNNNATNTSFKARSIALPQQSIGRDRQHTPVTRRHLNLDDLLGQLRHPSANVRRDAINGLEELLQQTNRGLSNLPLSRIIPNIVRLVSDEDFGVRKALLQFWRVYVKRIHARRIKPYMSIIILHISSSMSHIFPDIRIDAVKFLSVCLTSFGGLMVGGWQHFAGGRSNLDQPLKTEQEFGARILRCYLTLLGIPFQAVSQKSSDTKAGMTSSSQSRASILSTDLSVNAIYIILSSLDLFLLHAIGRGQIGTEVEDGDTISQTSDIHGESQGSKILPQEAYPEWIFTAYLQNEADQRSFLQSLPSRKLETPIERDVMALEEHGCAQDQDRQESFAESFQSIVGKCYGMEYDDFSDLKSSTSPSQNSLESNGAQLELFRSLVTLLQNCFLEAAPSTIDPRNANVRMADDENKANTFRIMNVIISICLHLWRGVFCSDEGACEDLSKFLDRAAPYFPFGGSSRPSKSIGNGRREINMIGEEVQEDWLDINLSFCELVGLLSSLRKIGFGQNKQKKLVKYVEIVSDYIIDLFKNKSERDALHGSRLIATLPTIWLLLNQFDDQKGTESMIDGLLQHWNGLPSNSPSKIISTRFLGHLILLPTYSSFNGRFYILNDPSFRARIVRWVTVSLPKRLWELNIKNIEETEEILEILRRVTVCYGRELEKHFTEEEVKALIKPFLTFFCVQHAQRGQIDGPFKRLSHQVQRRALAVLHNLPFDEDLFAAARSVKAL